MKYIVLTFVLLIIGATGCRQTTAPSGGTFNGYVHLFDVSGNLLSSSMSGISVWIPGTAYRTVTDSNGQYVLKYIPYSIDTIMFSKAGFDTCFFTDIESMGVGEEFIDTAQITQIPTDDITLDHFDIHDTVIGYYPSDTKYITYSGHISSNAIQTCYLLYKWDTATEWMAGSIDTVQNGIFSGTIWWLGSRDVPIASGQHFQVYPMLLPLIKSRYNGRDNEYGFGPRKDGDLSSFVIP